jgi:hypothetical protein
MQRHDLFIKAGRPVAKLARAGTQIGESVYAFVNRVPLAARASIVGVLTKL